MKAEARPAATRSSSCKKCGKQQHGPNGCPATEATCTCCGKTGHWSHKQGYPAQCRICNRYGHFDQMCRILLTRHQQPSKPRNPKPGKEKRSTFHVVEPQASSSVRRVKSTARERLTPSPTISVVVTHAGVSETINVIPDTGADR